MLQSRTFFGSAPGVQFSLWLLTLIQYVPYGYLSNNCTSLLSYQIPVPKYFAYLWFLFRGDCRIRYAKNSTLLWTPLSQPPRYRIIDNAESRMLYVIFQRFFYLKEAVSQNFRHCFIFWLKPIWILDLQSYSFLWRGSRFEVISLR